MAYHSVNFIFQFLAVLVFVQGEVVEIQNYALYHVNPENELQINHLNRMRTSDSGMLFLNGIGSIGDTVEVLMLPEVLKHHMKEIREHKLEFEMQFFPVNIELLNNDTYGRLKLEKDPSQPELTDWDIEAKKRAHLMPIDIIREPNVFSGIFMRITTAHYPGLDVLQLSTKVNSTMGNPLLCIPMKKDKSDSHAEESDPSTQWIFEKTDKTSHYILRNKRYPSSYVTWEDDHESFLVVELRREFQRQYKWDGPLRDNVMFEVVRTGESAREYEIKILGLDGKNIHLVVDPVKKDMTDCYLIRRTTHLQTVDLDPLHHEFKFHMPERAITIVGLVHDMEYEKSVDELYSVSKTEGLVMTLTSKSIFNNNDHESEVNVIDVHEKRDKFRIKFDKQPMELFHEIYVPPGLCIGTMAMDPLEEEDEDEKNRTPTIELDLSPGKDTSGKFKYKITGKITVPPRSQVDYQVVFGWLEKVRLNFRAKLTMYGLGDRMTKGDLPIVVSHQMINFHYIYELLKDYGFNFQGGEGDPQDPVITSYSVPISGSVLANTLGIKGEILTQIQKLSRNSSIACE